MHFALNDGQDRASNKLRADAALLTGSQDGILVGEASEQEINDFTEASEELYRFVQNHAADSALLAYRSVGRSRGHDDTSTAVVWPAGRWPRIKLCP